MRKMFIGLAMAFLVASCGKKEVSGMISDDVPLDSAALKVAVMPTLDCLPLYVAETSGMFGREGVNVQLCRYQAQMDCDTAIARRRVEGMMTDLVRAERLKQQGMRLHYATATQLSWQLLTSRTARIRQAKQLDDKMLAMTRYSATAMLADEVVAGAGLQDDRVFRIQVNDVSVRLNMLENGIMDALFLPEPQATQARNLQAHVLMDTAADSLWLGVLAFNRDLTDNSVRRQQIEQLLKVYNQACDSINAYGLPHYAALIEQQCQVSKNTIDSLPVNYHFRHASLPDVKAIDKAGNWLKKQ